MPDVGDVIVGESNVLCLVFDFFADSEQSVGVGGICVASKPVGAVPRIKDGHLGEHEFLRRSNGSVWDGASSLGRGMEVTYIDLESDIARKTQERRGRGSVRRETDGKLL